MMLNVYHVYKYGTTCREVLEYIIIDVVRVQLRKEIVHDARCCVEMFAVCMPLVMYRVSSYLVFLVSGSMVESVRIHTSF